MAKDAHLRGHLLRQVKNQVIIVIPVYKEKMTHEESISLRQCMTILHCYPIVLVAPENLDLSAYLLLYPQLTEVRFPPGYFDGIHGYNQLTMSVKFYEEFLEYRYMLIYQLDCYVFKDELSYWCEQGYDYIGAPWMGTRSQIQSYRGWEKRLTNNERFLRKKIRRYFKKPFEDVGNGGLSLRRVKKFLLTLKLFDYRVQKWDDNEDVFYSIIAPILDLTFKIPDKKTAMRFSIETEPSHCYKLISEKLPFGCHAWEKYEPEFWQHFICKTPET